MKKKNEDVSLRPATDKDAKVVCELWLSLMKEHETLESRFVLSDDAALRWKNDFPLWVDDGTRKLMLAEKAGQVIGFIQAHRRLEPPVFKETPEVFIDEIYVLPESRCQGVGEALLKDIQKWTTEVGGERIRLRVLSANKPGIVFWERVGGSKIDVTYTIELESKPAKEMKARSGRLGF